MKSRYDMHPADIIALLHKKKLTLAGVFRRAGLHSATLANVLTRPWPKGEFLIAAALDIHPSLLWPSRYYDENGDLIDRHSRIKKK